MKLLGAKLRGIFAKFFEALPPSLPTPPKQSLRLRRPGAKDTEGSPRLHPRSKLRGIRRRRINEAGGVHSIHLRFGFFIALRRKARHVRSQVHSSRDRQSRMSPFSQPNLFTLKTEPRYQVVRTGYWLISSSGVKRRRPCVIAWQTSIRSKGSLCNIGSRVT
jgi:hypothetical protein